MNNQKRMNWSNSEVSEMLEIIKEKKILNLCDRKKYRSLEIYKNVAGELIKKNITRTPDQIRTKLKALRKLYSGIRKKNAKSGSAREECDHYNLLEEIFGDRPILTCLSSGIDSGRSANKDTDSNESSCSIEEFNNLSTSSSCSDSNKQRRKRKITKEEKLMEMHHKWLEEEFEKQRKFEKDIVEDFKKTIKDSIRNLMQPGSSSERETSTPERDTDDSSFSSISDFFGNFDPNT